MRLKDEVAIVTGGAGCIGRAIAARYAKEGAAVAVVDRNAEGAHDVAALICAGGGKAISIAADLTQEDQVVAMLKKSEQELGKVTILVNGAGSFEQVPIFDTTQEQWDRMMNDNLNTCFLCTKAVGERMGQHGYGRIVNIGSTSGERGRAKQHAYGAAKSAILTFTMSAGIQLGPMGVNVNCIVPGILEDTDHPDMVLDDAELMDYTLHRMPIERWGKAEEVTEAAVFFASREISYITCQTLAVDGGLTARLGSCGEDR